MANRRMANRRMVNRRMVNRRMVNRRMTYEEFCAELNKRLSEKAGEYGIIPENIIYYKDGFEPESEEDLEFVRDTNIRYHQVESDKLIDDYVVLKNIGRHSQVARFSVKHLYECEESGGWDLVWANVEENLKLSRKIEETEVMDHLFDYNLIKERLIVRPLNFTNRKYDLKDAVYRRIGDIALTLYALAYETRKGERHDVGSIRIRKSMFESWEKDEDEVWDSAILNTNIIAPPRLYFNPMDSYKPSYEKGAFMALGNKMKIAPSQVPLMTTTMQINGAIAIFYPGVQKRIAEMIDGDYYVAFTSISEIHIHKCGTIRPLSVLRRVKEMNKMTPKDDILTYKLYMYDSKKDELRQLEL